jgi:hypothetical protein
MTPLETPAKDGAVDCAVPPAPQPPATVHAAEAARQKVNLLGLDRAGLLEYCATLGEKPFRALQLLRWIHHRGVGDWGAMTDLARGFRDRLRDQAVIAPPAVLADHTAADATRKWLFDVGVGNAVEAVFIPEARRGTLCISTQAGCAVNCRFCSTGKQGFSRNLDTAEILGQVWTAGRLLSQDGAVTRWQRPPGAAEAGSAPAGQGVFASADEPADDDLDEEGEATGAAPDPGRGVAAGGGTARFAPSAMSSSWAWVSRSSTTTRSFLRCGPCWMTTATGCPGAGSPFPLRVSSR